jgi:hypothetical protein
MAREPTSRKLPGKAHAPRHNHGVGKELKASAVCGGGLFGLCTGINCLDTVDVVVSRTPHEIAYLKAMEAVKSGKIAKTSVMESLKIWEDNVIDVLFVQLHNNNILPTQCEKCTNHYTVGRYPFLLHEKPKDGWMHYVCNECASSTYPGHQCPFYFRNKRDALMKCTVLLPQRDRSVKDFSRWRTLLKENGRHIGSVLTHRVLGEGIGPYGLFSHIRLITDKFLLTGVCLTSVVDNMLKYDLNYKKPCVTLEEDKAVLGWIKADVNQIQTLMLLPKEHSKSSCGAPTEENEEISICNVCFEPYARGNDPVQACVNCHLFCTKCTLAYQDMAVEKGQPIKCPLCNALWINRDMRPQPQELFIGKEHIYDKINKQVEAIHSGDRDILLKIILDQHVAYVLYPTPNGNTIDGKKVIRFGWEQVLPVGMWVQIKKIGGHAFLSTLQLHKQAPNAQTTRKQPPILGALQPDIPAVGARKVLVLPPMKPRLAIRQPLPPIPSAPRPAILQPEDMPTVGRNVPLLPPLPGALQPANPTPNVARDYQSLPPLPGTPISQGGAVAHGRRHSRYNRTAEKVRGADGISRTVYVKGVRRYVKRKNKRSGTYRYAKCT